MIDDDVEFLNKFCDGTLSITHWQEGWEITSHGENTFFALGKQGPVNAPTFRRVVNAAFDKLYAHRIAARRQI